MKITIDDSRWLPGSVLARGGPSPLGSTRPAASVQSADRSAPAQAIVNRGLPIVTGRSGFTMIEIALCLAIIGFALVSILLVLPSGMNTQRETREETIISQDASMLLEAVRSGARGLDDLTNNVYAITNYVTHYSALGVPQATHTWGYTFASASLDGTADAGKRLTNGVRIIGLLSTPEFTDFNNPIYPVRTTFNTEYVSNHVVAYVRSFSGLAAEKPPQNNQIMQEDTFSYRVLCVNAPLAADTNVIINPGYTRQLADNLRELRMTFYWPQLPNGRVGVFRQTFRSSLSGQLTGTYDPTNNLTLYFYQ